MSLKEAYHRLSSEQTGPRIHPGAARCRDHPEAAWNLKKNLINSYYLLFSAEFRYSTISNHYERLNFIMV